MKQKWILLISLLLNSKVLAKRSLSEHQIWDKQYGIRELSRTSQKALASGLYYLLASNGDEQLVGSFVDNFCLSPLPHSCRNAYVKACEKSCINHLNNNLHSQSWQQIVLPYYSEVIKQLSKKNTRDLTIAFGSDQGKKLPTSFFELDRMLNSYKQVKPESTRCITQLYINIPGLNFEVYTQLHS